MAITNYFTRIQNEIPTNADLLITLLILIILVLIITISIAARINKKYRRSLKDQSESGRRLENKIIEVATRVQTMAETASIRDAHLTQTLNDRLDQVGLKLGQGLENSNSRTNSELRALHERLAVIDDAQKNLTELSGQVTNLRDIMANKQTRGAFGQANMEAIIKDKLPENIYSFQKRLSNNTIPDCAIKIPGNDIVLIIDAKLLLESITAFREAKDNHQINETAKLLRNNIIRHINDIASKYLLKGETMDTAISKLASQ